MSSVNKQYWRNLEEYDGASGPPAPQDADDPYGLSRRRWLQLMGASMALAGAGGCRWEKTELRGFAKRPPGRTPGKTEKFATAMELGGSALGLMVTCVDGRPIKIEGNPKHPYSLGATNAFAQAAILELYDPDRSKNIIQKTPEGDQVRNWDEFAAFAKQHFGELRKTGGEGFAVLTEGNTSDTLAFLVELLQRDLPKAKWYEYEPIEQEHAPHRIMVDSHEAQIIVCLDADLFGSHPAAVQHARNFAEGRDGHDGRMNRLYVVESRYTITGAAADHRLALRSHEIAAFAEALRQIVTAKTSKPNNTAQLKPQSPVAGDVTQAESLVSERVRPFLRAVANDLVTYRAQSVVVVGPGQPDALHQAVFTINSLVGNGMQTVTVDGGFGPEPIGPRVNYVDWWRARQKFARPDSIASLATDIRSDKLKTLLLLGGNPAYNAPVDLAFAEALKKVETTIHLSGYRDETSHQCTWHLPQAHFLEAWGDVRAFPAGDFSIVQPMIAPLYDSKSAIEVMGLLVNGTWPNVESLVQQSLAASSSGEQTWRETLHDGVSEFRPSFEIDDSPSANALNAAQSNPTPARADDDSSSSLDLIFYPDSKLYDGRFANNAWLQEMPDPMTKLTWDNAALMSPATAKKLGVAHEDVVKLKFKGREVEAPVYVMPGQADGTVAVSLGYGRTAAGKVGGSATDGIEPVGFDAYKLRTTDAMWFGTGLTVEPTGKKHRFATTHDRLWIDKVGSDAREERAGELVRETTLAEYETAKGSGGGDQGSENAKSKMSDTHPSSFLLPPSSNPQSPIPNPSASSPHPNPLPKGEGTGQSALPTGEATEGKSLWQEPAYTGRRWGMTIDLSKCVGCGTCVVACQAENNVPVVGKEQVRHGREMHWLRIDRYFEGDPAAPKVVFQPLPCQQCELAPCEQVCPVGATAHSKEGLNDMAYNRCIGVRYCANNCPFKVRRFNFFNYHKNLEDPANEVLKMVYNPEVTVRSRGVMEKCTYCVQRIQAAKIDAKNHRRTSIPDGEIKTACQQACPAGAIVFGDLGDKESMVARQHQSPRNYVLLAELNVKPRTSYMTRIRNPNPELEARGEGREAGDKGRG